MRCTQLSTGATQGHAGSRGRNRTALGRGGSFPGRGEPLHSRQAPDMSSPLGCVLGNPGARGGSSACKAPVTPAMMGVPFFVAPPPVLPLEHECFPSPPGLSPPQTLTGVRRGVSPTLRSPSQACLLRARVTDALTLSTTCPERNSTPHQSCVPSPGVLPPENATTIQPLSYPNLLVADPSLPPAAPAQHPPDSMSWSIPTPVSLSPGPSPELTTPFSPAWIVLKFCHLPTSSITHSQPLSTASLVGTLLGPQPCDDLKLASGSAGSLQPGAHGSPAPVAERIPHPGYLIIKFLLPHL